MNYSDSYNWVHLPVKIEHEVDVLYFYPTICNHTIADCALYCSINNSIMRESGKRIYLKQATAFETVADIYMPYYRQLYTEGFVYMTREEILDAERQAPKTDIYRALDYYFQNYNQGRPFILAGHSQGAAMIYIALEEYFKECPEYYKNMVVAYMLGFAPTKEWFLKNPHLKAARGETDTGVVVAWNTEGPGNRNAKSICFPKNCICINPLNWCTDETYAGVEENKGCCVKNENGDYVVVKGFADARINPKRGTVVVTSVDSEKYAVKSPYNEIFGPDSYHMWEVNFWYMNLRENVRVRTEHFLKNR